VLTGGIVQMGDEVELVRPALPTAEAPRTA
jgi:hypothetical protein